MQQTTRTLFQAGRPMLLITPTLQTSRMRQASLLILLASAGACAAPAHTLPPPAAPALAPQEEAHALAFDRADRSARTVLDQIHCARRVATLRREGAFGPIDSLGGRGQCAVMGDRRVGVFFDSDTLFSAVSRLSAVDLAGSARVVGSIDTAGILAVARASRAAQLRGRDAYERAERPYTPIAFRSDGDSIEVWLIPAAVFTGSPVTVGGERGYVFSADGRSVVREIDAFGTLRALAVPDAGAVRIPSGERAVPLMTELLVANVLHERGRTVTIDMQSRSARLVGNARDAVWVHVPR